MTSSTTQRPGVRLKRLERYANPHAAAGSSATSAASRSYARTETIVSATSWP